ncbi:hypothetical protein [Halopelagius fulvigenes]|uniref:Small CPxCG-related zinc finger protein n=1 Tax=Halopelagius fulvigenes TaxID=1198324 RepID=A0ABD5U5V7_9EURY
MAHSPDMPERFVCTNCHAIFAGTPEGQGDSADFRAPDTCSACGETAFVSIERFVYQHQNEGI